MRFGKKLWLDNALQLMYNLNDYGVVCALLQAVKDEVKTMAFSFVAAFMSLG